MTTIYCCKSELSCKFPLKRLFMLKFKPLKNVSGYDTKAVLPSVRQGSEILTRTGSQTHTALGKNKVPSSPNPT